MPFSEFHSRFPQIAEKETRTATISWHDTLPADTYAFSEAFCDDEGCDCRRAFIYVYSKRHRTVIATLGYGWEPRSFYVDWFGQEDMSIDGMVGVDLPPCTFQSDFAVSEALVELFASMVEDEAYRERIKRHYFMFKQTVDGEQPAASRPVLAQRARVGRNEPCPCGSGVKYKKCCLGGALQPTG